MGKQLSKPKQKIESMPAKPETSRSTKSSTVDLVRPLVNKISVSSEEKTKQARDIGDKRDKNEAKANNLDTSQESGNSRRISAMSTNSTGNSSTTSVFEHLQSMGEHSDTACCEKRHQRSLDCRQSKLVRDSWQALTIRYSTRMGIQFFLRFFLTFPYCRNFYPRFRSDNDVSDRHVNCSELRELRNDPSLTELGQAYVKELSSIIRNLNNEKELETVLKAITDRHCPWGVLHVHFHDMMSALLAFVENSSGNNFTSNHRECWKAAVRIILQVIDDYYLQLHHKKVKKDEAEDEDMEEVEEKEVEENKVKENKVEENKVEEKVDNDFGIWGM